MSRAWQGRSTVTTLGCEESSPVLLLEQVIRLDDETPIEWSFTWLKAGQEVVGTAVQPS